MSGRCAATKRDGGPCTLPSYGPAGLCWAHDPNNAENRRKGQSRGGRGSPGREISGIKALLSGLTRRVLGEEDAEPSETGRAAVANQLANTLLRAIEQQRRQRELEEIAGRVEALEEVLKGRRTGWARTGWAGTTTG